MAHGDARAWWADVQHLRDDYARTDEARRRADLADLAERRAVRERRHVDGAGSPRRQDHAAEHAPRRPDHVAERAPRRDDVAPVVEPVFEPMLEADPAALYEPSLGTAGAPARRTIEIRGRTVPAPPIPPAGRVVALERRRPARLPVERLGARPDRMALWALMMGVMLIAVAVLTADASAASL